MSNNPPDDYRPHTEHVRPRTGMLKNPYNQFDTSLQPPTCVRFLLPDGETLDATARPYIVLGREDNENRQQIDVDFGQIGGRENGISRCHAIMQVADKTVYIKDFNSRNGTFLNGYELHPMKSYVLQDGDELALGRIKMRVKFIY